MFLTNNYKTLKLRNSDVGEMGWNPDHWLKHEVVKFGDVLKDVLTNGEFHFGRNDRDLQRALTYINDKYENFNHITELITRYLALKDQQPTMEEVLTYLF